MIDKMLCPNCGGEFHVIEVEERKTGRKGYVLECVRCEYFSFDADRWPIRKVADPQCVVPVHKMSIEEFRKKYGDDDEDC